MAGCLAASGHCVPAQAHKGVFCLPGGYGTHGPGLAIGADQGGLLLVFPAPSGGGHCGQKVVVIACPQSGPLPGVPCQRHLSSSPLPPPPQGGARVWDHTAPDWQATECVGQCCCPLLLEAAKLCLGQGGTGAGPL
eukprot:4772269-Lingulodinium_polyedra.AAC.1